MFRIEAFVEDKRLAEALRALAGLVRGQPSVTPVANVTKGLRAKTNGRLLEMFSEHLAAKKIAQFRAIDVREYLRTQGLNETSYHYLIDQVRNAKLVRKTGKGTAVTYHVIKKG